MAKVFEIELDDKGIQEMLKSNEVGNLLQEYGDNIANSAEGNYEVKQEQKQKRTIVKVAPADKKTHYRNLNANYLVKAVQRVRK